MKRSVSMTQKEVNKIMAKHFKIKPSDIIYAGYSGMFDYGDFRVEYKEEEK